MCIVRLGVIWMDIWGDCVVSVGYFNVVVFVEDVVGVEGGSGSAIGK